MSDASRALVERAIVRSRNNALQQLGITAIATAALPLVWGGFNTIVIVFVVLNVWFGYVFARRWLRVRADRPAVKALLDAPAEIREIAAWPPKLPPGRMPIFLDIKTAAGAQCSLLLEPKHPQMIVDLVGALRQRSPEAIVLVPTLPANG